MVVGMDVCEEEDGIRGVYEGGWVGEVYEI